jgi:hypothetical protein
LKFHNIETFDPSYSYRPYYHPREEPEYYAPIYRYPPRERSGFKFKVLPFELQLSESAFHMVTMNELCYLNSLAGKIQKMPHERIDRMKALARNDFGRFILL